MENIILNHRFVHANRCDSPNHDDRPDPEDISLIVIHNISLPPGEYGGEQIIQFFCNQLDHKEHPFFETIKELKVASHILIDRDGDMSQFVPFNKRAWHAGESEYKGQKNCNDFSIGIELEGTDNEDYTEEQYQQLIHVTKELMKAYPRLSIDRIVGHSEIAPGRKTDPGESFNWGRYLGELE